jgi:hypothetical protein
MNRLVALVVFLGIPAPAGAKLDVRDVKAVYGLFGPPRKSLDTYPGDEVHFRFLVTGARTDADGRIDATITVRMVDSKDMVLVNSETPLKGPLALGGDSYSATAFFTLGPSTTPGDYKVTVTVNDKLAKETASFERKVRCLKPEFAIVNPRFCHDGEGKVPASYKGVRGQTLFFHLKVIGFDQGKDKLHVTMETQLFDQKGKALMPKPVRGEVRTEDKETIRGATSVFFKSSFGLGRVGDYRLRITVTDEVSKKRAVFEAPVEVMEP